MNKDLSFQRYFIEDVLDVEDIHHVGNNQIYRVRLQSGWQIVKRYSKAQHDGWNRGRTEFETLKKLREFGIENVPVPHLFDEESSTAVYSMEEGETLNPKRVTRSDIRAIASFLASVHNLPASAVASLPLERTSCLSGEEYLSLINNRYRVIDQNFTDKFLGVRARDFFYREVSGAIREFEQEMRKGSHDAQRKLLLEEQRLNPGDFGPHNVLFDGSNGKYIFHDFEFSGRDDPAKQVLDFLHHAKTADVDKRLKEEFVENYFSLAPHQSDSVRVRLRLFDKAVGLNWALIYLNVLSMIYQKHLEFGTGNDLEKIVSERFNRAQNKIRDLTYFK